jgi:hypothetical protein
MEESTHTWCRAAQHTHNNDDDDDDNNNDNNNNMLPPRDFIGEIRYYVLLFVSLWQYKHWQTYNRR